MLSIEGKEGVISHPAQHFVYEGALSQCYTLKVQLRLDEALDFKQIVFQNAHLSYTSPKGERQFIHGFVSDLEVEYDPAKTYYFNTLTIRPFLYLLHYSRQFRVFNKQSYLSQAQLVVNNLLKARGLPANRAEFNITDPLLTTEFNRSMVQYADNDLAFFEQTLQMGARYYFIQHEDFEQLVVIDTPQALPNREQVIEHLPDKKDAITQNESPVFYHFGLNQGPSRKAKPFYFDPYNPAASRARVGNGSQEELGFTAISCYAPTDQYDLIAARLTDQLNAHQKTFSIGSYYSDLLIGEHLQVQRYQCLEPVDVFIESLKIHGQQYNEVWRFEVSGLARLYSDQGAWLGPYQAPTKMPGFLRGGMIPELAPLNDMGQHQVQFPIDLAAGNENPLVMLRELQETTTQGGGVAHSVTGKAEVLLASQNGLNTDWLIVGSLTNEGRESTVTPDNYRQSKIQTSSGLSMHLTRQDAGSPYGQLGMHLQDSNAHAAHINLGTNQNLLDTSAAAHGIQESSSGYAKRVASGNHYDTVGAVNNPVSQSALTQDAPGGFTQHHTEVNVGQGTYTQVYQSDAAGMKHVQAANNSKQARVVNPQIVHYFYVMPEKTDIMSLSKTLMSTASAHQNMLFNHINLQVYGGILPAGAWVYLPMANQSYQVDDIAAVQQGMQQIQRQVDQTSPDDLSAYGLWHQVFGWFLDNAMTFENSYFQISSKSIQNQLNQVSDMLNKIGQINAEAKASVFAGSAANAAQFRMQAQAAGASLHTQVQTFLDKLGLPDDDFKTHFENDTGLAYNRNILGIKSTVLGGKELELLSQAKLKGLTISSAARITGYVGTGLNGVTNAADTAETCRKYGDGSTLCHETAVGDTAYFGASEALGDLTGGATAEWLGCNALLDFETLGLGTIGCTIAVGGIASGVGGASGFALKELTESGYNKVTIYDRTHHADKK